MGSFHCQLFYPGQRGSHAPGKLISDPHDWIRQLLITEFNETKAKYNAAPAEFKTQIDSVFGKNIFNRKQDAQFWFDVNEYDDDAFARAKENIELILSQ